MAFRLTWDRGCIIESIDLRDNARLVAGLDLPERSRILLEDYGPMFAARLAEITGATERVINAELGRDSRFTMNSEDAWKLSESNW
jgi:hypothetical protein